MRGTTTVLLFLVALGGFCPSRESRADDPPVEVWSHRITSSCPNGELSILDARTLADGRSVLAVSDAGALVLATIPPDGTEPTATVIETPADVRLAAIDPFGDVVAAWRQAGAPAAMRYDGVTGRPLWRSSAARLSGASDAFPGWLLIDAGGDVLLTTAREENLYPASAVFKLAGSDGRVLWGPAPLLAPGEGQPYVAGARVDEDGGLLLLLPPRVCRFEGKTGRRATCSSDPTLIYGDLLATGGTGVFVAAGEYGLAAFQLQDGRRLWSSTVPSHVESALIVSPGHLFLVTNSAASPWLDGVRNVWKLFVETGEVEWGPIVSPVGGWLGEPGRLRMLVDGQRDLVLTGGQEGAVLARHDGRTGQLLWSIGGGDEGRSWIGAGALLRAADAGSLLVTRDDPGSGLQITRYDADGRPVGPAARLLPRHATQFGYGNSRVLVAGGLLVAATLEVTCEPASQRLEGRDPESGRVVWTLTDPTGDGGGLAGIASDPAGGVVVLARHETELRLAKVSGATGQRLWGPVVLATFEPWSASGIMAVDPVSGDVAVCVNTPEPALLRFDGSSGALESGPAPVPFGVSQLLFRGDVLVAVGRSGVGSMAAAGYAPSVLGRVWGPLLQPAGSFGRAALDATNAHFAFVNAGAGHHLAVDARTGTRAFDAELPASSYLDSILLDGHGRALRIGQGYRGTGA